MKAAQRLRLKLERGVINARELRTLLRQEGWKLDRTRGSHEIWTRIEKTFVLATHSKELKRYQVRLAQAMLPPPTEVQQ